MSKINLFKSHKDNYSTKLLDYFNFIKHLKIVLSKNNILKDA